jgi:hypothetical protein
MNRTAGLEDSENLVTWVDIRQAHKLCSSTGRLTSNNLDLSDTV